MTDLIERYESEAKAAAKQLEERREEAHAAAVAARDALTDEVSAEAQREDLTGIIADALEDTDEAAATSAPMVVYQLTTQIANPKVKAGDGGVLLDVFLDAAKGFTDEQRTDALKAVLLMASGRANAGLFRFGKPWDEGITLPTLRQFAAILDKHAYNDHADELARKQAEQRTASRYADALSPRVTITPTTRKKPEAVPELVEVANHNEGTPLSIAGVRFPGHGKRTQITAEEFEQVRQSPIWKSGVEVGALEVTNDG